MTWHQEAAKCQAASEHRQGGQLRSCLSQGCCSASPTPTHSPQPPPLQPCSSLQPRLLGALPPLGLGPA